MYERLATWFVYAFYLYFSLGLLFAIVFVTTGVKRLDRDGANTAVEISSSPKLLAPDVLVYGSPSKSKSDLPAEALLLGTFVSGKTYRLPSENSRFVLLYSLPRKELLATLATGDER